MLPGMLPSREKQLLELERLGESEVRYFLADMMETKNFDEIIAREWLSQREQARYENAALRRDSRESKTLLIAIAAMIIAAIAAHKEIIWIAHSLKEIVISWFH